MKTILVALGPGRANSNFMALPQKVRKRPGEAIRVPSRSSTALDPEPTAQTDPKRTRHSKTKAPPKRGLLRLRFGLMQLAPAPRQTESHEPGAQERQRAGFRDSDRDRERGCESVKCYGARARLRVYFADVHMKACHRC